MGAAQVLEVPDTALFRKAMGGFAAGVTVVTTALDGRLSGTTVSAFSSLSMDPPLVLACLKRGSRTLAAVQGAGVFCVNILAADQGELAYAFAKSGCDERFALAALEPGATAAPVLAGCVAVVECALHATHDGGDHEILVGRVASVRINESKPPLVYVRGQFLNT